MKKSMLVCLWMLILVSSVPAFPQQRVSPAIAVAANGNTVSASVGNQPGRSPYFLLFDAKGAFIAAASNPYKDAGNAGIPTLDFLASKGIKVLVSESYGPKIVEVMKDKGIRPVEFRGSARDAVQKVLQLK